MALSFSVKQRTTMTYLVAYNGFLDHLYTLVGVIEIIVEEEWIGRPEPKTVERSINSEGDELHHRCE